MTNEISNQELAMAALKIMEGYADAGIRRATPEGDAQIEKFEQALDEPAGAPWCASAVTYAWLKALAEMKGSGVSLPELRALEPELLERVFLPSASCGAVMRDAEQRGSWLSNEASDDVDVQSGWLVTFDWSGAGRPRHIGIVIDASETLRTVEGNTANGRRGSQRRSGCVARRTRGYDDVLGFVKTWLPDI